MAVTLRHNYTEITYVAATEQESAEGAVNLGGFSQIVVEKIRWVVASGGALGDNAQILDAASGNVIWESVNTAGTEFVDDTEFHKGFVLRAATGGALQAIVDTGTLYLYHKM